MMSNWKDPPVVARAGDQAAQGIITYGLPDDWANYGESLQQFCAFHKFPTCKHTDTDMSSNEEITRFDAEKNKPVAVFSDIGIAFGPVAEARAVLPPYLPPNAKYLPAGWKAKTGGLGGAVGGGPTLIRNTDVVKKPPKTRGDLPQTQCQGAIWGADSHTPGTHGG